MPSVNVPIIVQLGDDFVEKLAEAIVRKQLGGQAVTTSAAAPADDWPSVPAEEDPWGAPTGGGGSHLPPVPTQAPTAAPAAGPTTFVKQGRNGPQTITLNLPDAPRCAHGQAAALVEGATNGKPWKRYTCALSTGQDWRNKCDFSQFTR